MSGRATRQAARDAASTTSGVDGTVTVLGGGTMALAVVALLDRAGAQVRLWARDPAQRERAKLAGALVSEDVGAAVAGSRFVFFAVPAYALPEVAARYGPHAQGDHVVVHAARGVAAGFVLPHKAIRAEACVRRVGALGGPLYLEDLGEGRPLVAMLASRYDETFDVVRALVHGSPVRLHTSHDVVGVEVAGAISNVAALAAGMADGLGLTETDQGVLLTRGLAEASRLGRALGADAATFAGLAGVGDLIPRRVASTLKHRAHGKALAAADGARAATSPADARLEGVVTAREARALAAHLRVDLPLVDAVAAVVDGTAAARDALERVLSLDLELERLAAPTAR